jgi:hypothetical protein
MLALKFSKFYNQTQCLVITYIHYNETIIWETNKNRIIGGKHCLKLGFKSIDMILQDIKGSSQWFSSASRINRLEVMDSSNLVSQETKNVIIWVSFDYPTNTTIQGGYMGSGKTLVLSNP